MSRSSRKRARGTSLFELLIASALVGLIMTVIYSILIYGIQYYQTQSTTVEIQQNALVAMSALTNELVESNGGSLRTDQTDPIRGIVFGSPRNSAGQVNYNNTKLRWSKFVCYYLDVVNDVPCLMRTEKPLSEFTFSPPVSLNFPPPVSPAWDCEFFRNDPRLPKRIVARHITGLITTQSFPLPLTIEASTNFRYEFKVEILTKVTLKN